MPQNQRIQDLKAQALVNSAQGSHELAIIRCQEIIALDSSHVEAHVLLWFSMMMTQDVLREDAMDVIAIAREIDSDKVDELIVSYAERLVYHDLKEAINDLRKQ